MNYLTFIINLLKQFIFFSGLGVDIDKNSRRSNAIYKSEYEAFKTKANSTIIRPGVIIGGGDVFLKKLLHCRMGIWNYYALEILN